MSLDPEHRLQVLIANERDERLAIIRAIVEALGHDVVGHDVEIGDVGPLSRRTGAEVALVDWASTASTRSTRSRQSSVRLRAP